MTGTVANTKNSQFYLACSLMHSYFPKCKVQFYAHSQETKSHWIQWNLLGCISLSPILPLTIGTDVAALAENTLQPVVGEGDRTGNRR